MVDVEGDGPGSCALLERADVGAVDVSVTGLAGAAATRRPRAARRRGDRPRRRAGAAGQLGRRRRGPRRRGARCWAVAGAGRLRAGRRVARADRAPRRAPPPRRGASTTTCCPLDLVDRLVGPEGPEPVADGLRRDRHARRGRAAPLTSVPTGTPTDDAMADEPTPTPAAVPTSPTRTSCRSPSGATTCSPPSGDHQVVIVAGETGSGKSTQLPKLCLELGRGVTGLIGHTQPRRLAARTVAERVAEELGTELGRRRRLHRALHRPGRRRHAASR